MQFLAGARDEDADEELPAPVMRGWGAPQRVLAVVAVALMIVALIVRAAADRPDHGSRAAAGKAAPTAGPATDAFAMLGPGGKYTEVPYVVSGNEGAAKHSAYAGRLLDCVSGAICEVQRTLPHRTLAALRAAFADLQLEAAWSVTVVRPAPAPPQLQLRSVYGLAGSRSVDVEIRPAVPSDAALRIHWAGIEGTRTVFATVRDHVFIRVSAFERYESTPGLLPLLARLVGTGTLTAIS